MVTVCCGIFYFSSLWQDHVVSWVGVQPLKLMLGVTWGKVYFQTDSSGGMGSTLLLYWKARDSSAGCYLIHDEYMKKYIEGSNQFYFSGLQSKRGAQGTKLLKREKTTLFLNHRVHLDVRISHSSPWTDGYWLKEQKLVWIRNNIRDSVSLLAASSKWWYAGTCTHVDTAAQTCFLLH